MNANTDYFITPQMRRQLAAERSLEERADYAEAVMAVANEDWKCSWSMAGVYMVSLATDRAHDFTLKPEQKAKAKVIAAVPEMLAYIIEAAKTDDDAEALLNRLMESK
jgi:hypothetical protein